VNIHLCYMKILISGVATVKTAEDQVTIRLGINMSAVNILLQIILLFPVFLYVAINVGG